MQRVSGAGKDDEGVWLVYAARFAATNRLSALVTWR
jgi:hypothetical protein